MYHLYQLIVHGVRCERPIGILTQQSIPHENELPPLFIYPHGLTQQRLQIKPIATIAISQEALQLYQQFHHTALHMILPTMTPELTSDSNDWSYILVALVAPLRISPRMDDDQPPRVDEYDEIVRAMAIDEVRSELIQAATIMSGYVDTDSLTVDAAASTTTADELGPYPDDTFMKQFITTELQRSAAISATPTTSIVVPPPDPSLLAHHPRSYILETRYNRRLYLNLGGTTQITANSPFPSREYTSYADYYAKKWPQIPIPHPNHPMLLALNFSLTPTNVLQPHPMTEKKKQITEPEMYLVPDVVSIWTHCSADFVFALRMLPCILGRLETNLQQWRYAHQQLNIRINPTALSLALSTGNTQEVLPLQPPLNPQTPKENRTHHTNWYGSHPSTYALSYERLKFIGDALLKLFICKYLLVAHPTVAEESITQLKGTMLNMNRLHQAALHIHLEKEIRNTPFQPERYKPPGFTDPTTTSSSSSSYALSSTLPSKHVQADVLSALVGACWFSGGELTCLAFILQCQLIDQKAFESIIHPDVNLLISKEEQLMQSIHKRFFQQIPRSFTEPPTDALQLTLTQRMKVEQLLDYEFQSHMLYLQSFTHGSWEGRDTCLSADGRFVSPLPNFERLELLGDALIEVLASLYVLHSPPFTYITSSGDLTYLRQKLVNNQLLGRVILFADLDQAILHTSEPIKKGIQDYKQLQASEAKSTEPIGQTHHSDTVTHKISQSPGMFEFVSNDELRFLHCEHLPLFHGEGRELRESKQVEQPTSIGRDPFEVFVLGFFIHFSSIVCFSYLLLGYSHSHPTTIASTLASLSLSSAPPKLVSDVCESLIGSIYIDSNFSFARAFTIFQRLILPNLEVEWKKKLALVPM